MGAVTRDYSDEIPEGHVMEQKPRAGRRVKKGSKMNVTISMGPRPEESAGQEEALEETDGQEEE